MAARLAFAIALALATGACGRKPDVSGHWMGPLDFGPYAGKFGKPKETTMHIQFDIRAETGGLRVTMSREDENQPVPADRVEFQNGELIVAIEKRRHKQYFDLKLSEDGKEFRGNLRWDAEVLPITMKKLSGA